MELIHYYEDLNTLHVGTEKPRCYYLPKKTDGTDSYRLLSGNDWRFFYSVSYTHLTLPTIA